MVKLAQLECFVAVIDNGSINKAADQLFVTQPALSRMLKSLEEEMGNQLLFRKSQGVVPTKEGKMLYNYAQSILSEVRNLDKIKNINEMFTELTVSVYSMFIKSQLFIEFKNSCGSDDTSISIENVIIQQMIENLLSGISEIGLAVLSDMELPEVQRVARVKNLNIEILDHSPLYVHIGKGNPLCQKEKLQFKDLLDMTFLHLPFDDYSRSRLEMVVDGLGISDFQKQMTVNNYSVLRSMIKETDCFLLGNFWQKADLDCFGVASKQIENCQVQMHLAIITANGGKYLSPEAVKFSEIIKQYYVNGEERA